MGFIATLLKLSGAKSATKGNAPGKSAVATADGADGQTMETEIYQAPGVFGIPPDGVRAAWVPIGGSSRYGIALAVHNYQIEIDVNGAGGMAIYSTTSDGKTVKASVILKPDGSMSMTNENATIEIASGGKVTINGNLEIDV